MRFMYSRISGVTRGRGPTAHGVSPRECLSVFSRTTHVDETSQFRTESADASHPAIVGRYKTEPKARATVINTESVLDSSLKVFILPHLCLSCLLSHPFRVTSWDGAGLQPGDSEAFINVCVALGQLAGRGNELPCPPTVCSTRCRKHVCTEAGIIAETC
ncbi:uncharacterized protein PITG_17605 [Phytophthora infestans T30-4]|uniref:Uncharacterized protein n=1 Tax=Phytophthora infestans (strain T30-4) TaxID=403677 RepID=D0NWS8_PHYIT|nr:uncharacterized protein PITG_17605 [Phytophthora infestans T30-4]EEY67511.1 hypothetical protein PITG_17605 [Phytophthora infestans T30-4]|eukprot:XP_002896484.1 hypothetical protein PITG_17605 [Phytophthora infestans T30-4]